MYGVFIFKWNWSTFLLSVPTRTDELHWKVNETTEEQDSDASFIYDEQQQQSHDFCKHERRT